MGFNTCLRYHLSLKTFSSSKQVTLWTPPCQGGVKNPTGKWFSENIIIPPSNIEM